MQTMQRLIRLTCYPSYVLIFMGVYFYFAPMIRDENVLKLFLLGLTSLSFCLIYLHEWLMPLREEWARSYRDELSDALQTVIIFPVSIEVIFQVMKFSIGSPLQNFWPHQWHPAVQLLVLLVISEWGHYWYHRTSHRKKNLWKFHAVHHGAHRVYSLNSARFHLVDIALNMLVYMVPSVIFGLSTEVHLSFVLINSVTGVLEHANIDFNAGFLNYFFNSAQLHRWHHSEVAKESQKNFGKVLSIWDLVHGSFYLPAGLEVKKVGIGKRGVVPGDYLGQLMYPYKKLQGQSLPDSKAVPLGSSSISLEGELHESYPRTTSELYDKTGPAPGPGIPIQIMAHMDVRSRPTEH